MGIRLELPEIRHAPQYLATQHPGVGCGYRSRACLAPPPADERVSVCHWGEEGKDDVNSLPLMSGLSGKSSLCPQVAGKIAFVLFVSRRNAEGQIVSAFANRNNSHA